MATASVSVSRFQKSDLPPICVSSGVPAANVFSVRVGAVTGGLPLNGTVARQITRIQKLSRFAFAIGLGIFVMGVATSNPTLTGAALIPLFVAVGLLVLSRSRLPALRIKGDNVEMTRLHPGFVSALTKPPGACGDCSKSGECSVAEMDACDGEQAHSH